jgi:hypothetical protein
VTPAEPWKFYGNIAGSIFVLLIAALMMTEFGKQEEVEFHVTSATG